MNTQQLQNFYLFLLINIANSLVCMQQSTDTYPILLPFHPDVRIRLVTQEQKPTQTYNELISTHKNITILKTEQPHERFDKCFTVAITEHLGITGQAPEKLKISHTDDLIECLNIINTYYQPTKKPELNSLVTYINRRREITHFAIITNIDRSQPQPFEQIKVKSKLGLFPHLIEGGLFDVPHFYGKHVRFYNLKPLYLNNKELFLTTLQNAIKNNLKIQDTLLYFKEIFIDLAKGKNVFLAKDDDIFNKKYTLLQKTTLLLKTSMGLDINTHTKTNKNTVLMLATKRNDETLFSNGRRSPEKKCTS